MKLHCLYIFFRITSEARNKKTDLKQKTTEAGNSVHFNLSH